MKNYHTNYPNTITQWDKLHQVHYLHKAWKSWVSTIAIVPPTTPTSLPQLKPTVGTGVLGFNGSCGRNDTVRQTKPGTSTPLFPTLNADSYGK